jgi:hypothetical protein
VSFDDQEDVLSSFVKVCSEPKIQRVTLNWKQWAKWTRNAAISKINTVISNGLRDWPVDELASQGNQKCSEQNAADIDKCV